MRGAAVDAPPFLRPVGTACRDSPRPPMSQIVGLFPTPLMRVEQLLPKDLVQALVAQFEAAAAQENARSARLAHTGILAADATAELAQAGALIVPRLGEYGELLFGERLPWSIKEIWVNVLQTGGHQAIHNHANSFVSGIVYLTPSHASANTVFVKWLGGSGFVFSHANRKTALGPFNADKWIMPDVSPGDLVLFPSHLLHEVPPNQGGQRITLAFNAIPQRLDSWGYTISFTK